MDVCEGYEVTPIAGCGSVGLASEHLCEILGYDGLGSNLLNQKKLVERRFAARDSLACKVDFPRILWDKEGRVQLPFESVVAQAQEGIDDAVKELTPGQRERYLADRRLAVVPLFPSGAVHMVTLENGTLRLWDEASVAEALERIIEDDKGHSSGWPEITRIVEGGGVHNMGELVALAHASRCVDERVDGVVADVWESLAPLIRSGVICCADVVATQFSTYTMGHRNRAGECLAMRHLVEAEGWQPGRAMWLIDFVMALHHLAGDADFDLSQDLASFGLMLEDILKGASWIQWKRGDVRLPIDLAIWEAQSGIEDALSCLTNDQQNRYKAAMSYDVMPLFPSGGVCMVMLERGILRDVKFKELQDRYMDFFEGEVFPDAEGVNSIASLMAYRYIIPYEYGLRNESSFQDKMLRTSEWRSIMPLIREGRITYADVVATMSYQQWRGPGTRGADCLMFHRLVNELYWPPSVAVEVVSFVSALHCSAGDGPADMTGDLAHSLTCFEQSLGEQDGFSQIVRWLVYEVSAFAGYVPEEAGAGNGQCLCEWSRKVVGSFAHDVLAALRANDAEAVMGLLRPLYYARFGKQPGQC